MKKIFNRTPKEVYQRWLKALRSGKYKQLDGQLHDGGASFCCLGVLCDLARKDGGPDWDYSDYMGEDTNLPEEIRKFVRLTNKQESKLINMNDGGESFRKIADYIETKILPAKKFE